MATIEFGTWQTPEESNPYREIVDAMLAYIEEHTLADEDAKRVTYELTVAKDDALKTRTMFARAANERNRTARVRVNAEPIKDEKGKPTDNVRFVFSLTEKHKARKGAARLSDTESA